MRENVRVDVNTTIRVDLTLEAGAITEVLTVTADPPPLQSDRADTGRIIQGEQIAAMPLGFGRNFQGMVATVPGASRPFRPHSEFFNSQDSLSSNVNGQSRLANNVQIEGADNNHRTGLLTVLIPSAEALETVSVTTSNYDAEFGRAGGAVTNVTLKSGTNQFKGSGFYFGNTEATIATNPFVDRTLPKERQKARDRLPPGRLHARRPDHPQPAVLLRRLHPHQRRSRPHQPLHDPDRGDAQRRLQRVERADLRPADRRSRDRRRPHPVPGQPDSGRPHQPDRAPDPGQRAACRTSPARRSARSTTRTPPCASGAPTAST